MRLEKKSPCKVNLVLNILGKRPDGFHELETLMHPVNACDVMTFERGGSGPRLTCSHPELPCDSGNLVHRAATAFLSAARISDGVKIHLQKNLPIAGGMGGGSANAAVTLAALNELFGSPLSLEELHVLGSALGSDVPFFLYGSPALATGRGEKIRALNHFPALRGRVFLLVHPGFGISTPWAYQNLGRFPRALNGAPGRAESLADALQASDWSKIQRDMYNSLEAPAFEKYPVLQLYKEFFLENGALAALMSGSGSTTFAILQDLAEAEKISERFKARFGGRAWMTLVPV